MRLLKRSGPRSTGRRGQRRRRVVPLWRTPVFLLAAGTLGVVAVVGAAWAAWTSGVAADIARRAEASVFAATADLGLSVEQMFVIGRRETPRSQVMDAVGADHGSPILAIDIEAARQRLLALPWIREASVERLLPDTVVVRITEREPLALWQNQGAFALIDRQGEVIQRSGLGRFAHLIVVVGEDAPANAPALVDMLDRQPNLRRRVEAAVRVGERRWNIRLAGGVDVRLPEEDPEGAWSRLAEYERIHHVLEKDIQVLDLRFDDQVIVRRSSKPAEETAKGQET